MPKEKIEPTEAASADAQVAALQAEVAALKDKLAKGELPDDIAPLVRDKMNSGLTREQAIAVAREQVAHDAALAAAAKK